MIDPVLNLSYPLPEGLSSSAGGTIIPSDRARPLILGLVLRTAHNVPLGTSDFMSLPALKWVIYFCRPVLGGPRQGSCSALAQLRKYTAWRAIEAVRASSSRIPWGVKGMKDRAASTFSVTCPGWSQPTMAVLTGCDHT